MFRNREKKEKKDPMRLHTLLGALTIFLPTPDGKYCPQLTEQSTETKLFTMRRTAQCV